ncbi:glycosyltransferase family A protein [Sulfurovum mangrovi]|uniref:glycosyltransferase family A protein n=1 Tax=Sulfurovum mangrovi TaxID=2893889 RepID=UPI001E4620CE|nr:glycosyltransferase family A protein [Sulfurovum mangrovi]UFH59366.1 glycosyltransferase family 2 protein [Sulfurovum mangrovi]
MQNRKIIISCTSTKNRLNFLYYMLISLQKQTLQPDLIYINLSKQPYLFDEGISTLPDWLKNNEKVIVNFVENTGPYRKLNPLFEKNLVKDDDLIITADDDILYGENWIKNLVKESDRNPKDIVCCRARKMQKNIFGKYTNYSMWSLINKTHKQINILPTNGAGTVFKKSFLDIQFLLDKKYLNIAPTTDDLWFKMASMRKNINISACPYIDRENIYLKHTSGLDNINFLVHKKFFINKIYNNTIGKGLDYLGFGRTKNDLAWKEIVYFSSKSILEK